MFVNFLNILLLLLITQVESRNVLLVITDDMTSTAYDKLPNHKFFNTANVIKAVSSFPVCGPSRAALLTGLRPDTSKVYNFETYLNKETIFSYFKRNNYDTFVAGKVFHTLKVDKNIQFEYVNGHLTEKRVCLESGNEGCPYNNFFCKVRKSEDSCSINAAINFFKSRKNKTKKWIAAVGFHRPHLELTLKSNVKGSNKKIDFSVPIIYDNNGNKLKFEKTLSNIQHNDLGYLKVPINGIFTSIINGNRKTTSDLFTSKYYRTVNTMRKAYSNSVQETLNNFLKVVDNLYNILPNSINDTDIIFVADHGFQIGERKILGKNSLYPESTDIPLFFKIAGETSKRNINQYYSSIDIFPTLIELHNLHKMILDGVSIVSKQPPLAISQYPRCQPLGTIQTDDCMIGKKACGRPKILYMGYMVIRDIENIIYRYSEWYPFKEIRKVCEWPTWVRIPQIFKNNLGKWPVWTMSDKSYSDFSSDSINRELYIVDNNKLGENLINDKYYSDIVKNLSQLINGRL